MNYTEFFQEVNIPFLGIELIKEFLPRATWDCGEGDFMTLAENFDVDSIRRVDEFVNRACAQFSATPLIYRFPADTWYEWHVDAYNNCSLNMVLDDYDAKTIFKLGRLGDGSGSLYKTLELQYKPNTWYAFNSQKPHAIINGSQIRYLLTIGVLPPFTYDDLLAFCSAYQV